MFYLDDNDLVPYSAHNLFDTNSSSVSAAILIYGYELISLL